jgi:HAD superfamily hydrolase (TIGR01509 family)
MRRLKLVIFDWGDTVMRDIPGFKGPMVYWPRVEVMDGVEQALKDIHRKFTCCLASNADDSDAELIGMALERVNIKQYFHHLFSSKELGTKKPDAGFYRKILKKIDIQPGECIAVGNDYEKDILPAVSLGIKTVWLSPITPPGTRADVIIKSMNELPSVLAEL